MGTALHVGTPAWASSALPAGRIEPKARNLIYVHLVGGSSHVDLFDPKPELGRRDGELCPDSLFEGKRFAFIQDRPALFGCPWGFVRDPKTGIELSELLPELRTLADRMALVRSMHTDEFNHAPAQLALQTGFPRFGRPSLGAWLSYALGRGNEDLPAFVSMVTGIYPGGGPALFGSGFLPSVYQGVEFRSKGDPVLFLADPDGLSREDRRQMVDTIAHLNGLEFADRRDPEIASRSAQYDLAFRMQDAVPATVDLSSEPDTVRERYGSVPGEPLFANNCLLARRLVEKGVRVVQLFDTGWDHHMRIRSGLPVKCAQVDRPLAALVRDLAERGLLDETLVVVATEFGRTPMAQTTSGNGDQTKPGRDHHQGAFSVLLFGAGVRGGLVYGETDEFGYEVVRDPVHVHDLNATILHILGLDHEQLTYRVQGRDFRLTDVAGQVVEPLLA